MKFQILTLVVGVILASLLASTPQVWAKTESSQYQSQSMETSVSIDNGSGQVTAKASGSQSQSQTVTTSGSEHKRYEPRESQHYQPHSAKHYRKMAPTGQVTLTLPNGGGTCHIRYSEANQKTYHYTTVTACDNNEITIGGLVKNRSYRFQIKRDQEGWSAPILAIAK